MLSANTDESRSGFVFRHVVPDIGKAYVCFLDLADRASYDAEIGDLARTFSQVVLATYTRFVVHRRASEIERALDQANVGAQIDRMSLGFGHEARNLANRLQIVVDNVTDELATECLPQVEKAFKTIRSVVDALAGLCRKFLDFSRVSEQRYVYLSETVEIYTSFLRRSVKNEGMSLNVNLAKHLRDKAQFKNNRIFVDSGHIGQILANLVTNAVAAKKGSGGRIDIRTKTGHPEGQEHKYAVLECQDYGHGIRKEDRLRVWEAGFTTKAVGLGLGLHIVRRLVQENHGIIEYESAEERGTIFRVYFPVVGSEAANE